MGGALGGGSGCLGVKKNYPRSNSLPALHLRTAQFPPLRYPLALAHLPVCACFAGETETGNGRTFAGPRNEMESTDLTGCERRKRQEIIDAGADGGGALPHEESTHDGLATMTPEVGTTARTPPARPIGQDCGQHSAPAARRPGNMSRAEPIFAAATLLTSPSPAARSAAGYRAGNGDEPSSEGGGYPPPQRRRARPERCGPAPGRSVSRSAARYAGRRSCSNPDRVARPLVVPQPESICRTRPRTAPSKSAPPIPRRRFCDPESSR